MLKHLTYLAPWRECNKNETLLFNKELAKEISDEHALYGLHFNALACRSNEDPKSLVQVLFHLQEGVFDHIVVHMTFAGQVVNDDLPDVNFYLSHEEWTERCMKCPWY